jgi:hypothetical protein
MGTIDYGEVHEAARSISYANKLIQKVIDNAVALKRSFKADLGIEKDREDDDVQEFDNAIHINIFQLDNHLTGFKNRIEDIVMKRPNKDSKDKQDVELSEKMKGKIENLLKEMDEVKEKTEDAFDKLEEFSAKLRKKTDADRDVYDDISYWTRKFENLIDQATDELEEGFENAY